MSEDEEGQLVEEVGYALQGARIFPNRLSSESVMDPTRMGTILMDRLKG